MATNDQKQQARAKREEAQAAALAAQKRNRNLQILAGVVFAAIAVVVLVVLITSSKNKSTQGIGGDSKGEVQGVAATNDLLKGIPQSGLTIGDPKAPVTLIEFIDLQCPYCRDHQLDNQPAVIKQLVRTGKARVRFVPIAFLGEDSVAARATMLRLVPQNKAWNFINLMYWNQGTENTGYVTPAFLSKLAVAAGGKASYAEPRTPTGAGKAIAAESDDLQKTLLPDGPSTPSFGLVKTGQPLKTAKMLDLTQSTNVVGDLVKAVNEFDSKNASN